jgi:prophage regulatory protein
MTNPDQLLRIAEVSQVTSLGKSTINLWVARGKFPKPIMLSPTIKVWKSQQITEWVDSCIVQPDQRADESVRVTA